MERRDRIAQFRQRTAGSDVPRAIGAAVDEQEIFEMMERRGKAESTAVAADHDGIKQKVDAADSSRTEVVSTASELVGAEGTTAATAAAAADDAATDDSSGEGSMSGSEDEESEGSWTGEEEEGDSDIEEFYLKGGEGQMDEVEKKKKAAAEQKIVMVRIIPPMFSSNHLNFELHRRLVVMCPLRCNSRRSVS
jgi:hypothetical protein